MEGQADEHGSANGYALDVVFTSLSLMMKRWSMELSSIEVMEDEEKEERKMRANTAPIAPDIAWHCKKEGVRVVKKEKGLLGSETF